MDFDEKRRIIEGMIEKFMCPGCVGGNDPKTCEHFKFTMQDGETFGFCLKAHPGFSQLGAGSMWLGMPKGFNKVGEDTMWRLRARSGEPQLEYLPAIRLWASMELFQETGGWNYLNVPVWAREDNGYLFVRTYLPRRNETYIDVIYNGKLEDIKFVSVPMDVSVFEDEID